MDALPTSRKTADTWLQYSWNTSSLDLTCHLPKSLGLHCWYHLYRHIGHLPSNSNLVFQDVPIKGISAQMPHSFTLDSFIQPRHFSIPSFFLLPMAIPVHKASDKKLFFFSPSNPHSPPPQGQMPEASWMAAIQMHHHPYPC